MPSPGEGATVLGMDGTKVEAVDEKGEMWAIETQFWPEWQHHVSLSLGEAAVLRRAQQYLSLPGRPVFGGEWERGG